MLKVIAFDKDGTLLDVNKLWDWPSIKVVEDLLEMSGLTSIEKDQLKTEIGIVDNRLLPNTLFSAGSIRDQAEFFCKYVDMEVDQIEEFIENSFIDSIKALPEEAIRPIDGVSEAVYQLSQEYQLAIVTNDYDSLTKLTLEKAGLLKYFSFIAAADKYQQKPHPASLDAMCETFQVTSDQVVYIGDSSVDIEFGKLTKASIAYCHKPEYMAHLSEADYVFSDYKDLLPLIKEIDA